MRHGLQTDGCQHNAISYLQFISRFGLANKVPIDGEISFKDLAATIGINTAATTSILRLGIAFRIFTEPHPGFIAHSAASRQMVNDTRVSDWVAVTTEELWPATQKLTDALTTWPKAAEPNQTVRLYTWLHLSIIDKSLGVLAGQQDKPAIS